MTSQGGLQEELYERIDIHNIDTELKRYQNMTTILLSTFSAILISSILYFFDRLNFDFLEWLKA